MNTIYVVNVYSLDKCGEIEDTTQQLFAKTLEEAVKLERIIYLKLVELELTKEYYVEIDSSEFVTSYTFDERKELNYLYEYREYLDQEAKEEQERIQRMENEYNSLTDKQKEIYDNAINISELNLNNIATSMDGMFSECKDFHTIAMEEAKNKDLN